MGPRAGGVKPSNRSIRAGTACVKYGFGFVERFRGKEGRGSLTAEDRGSARLARLLADPQRVARVAAIREQMNQPSPDSPGLDDRTTAPRSMTVNDLHRAADAADDVNNSEVMDAAWRRRSI